MLDIEFLRKDAAVKQTVTYTVTTRLNLPAVRKAIQSWARGKGYMYREIDYTNLLYSAQESPLFGEPFLELDLSRLREVNKEASALIQQLWKAVLEKKVTNRIWFIAQTDDPLKDDPNWLSLQRLSTKLEEPQVTSGQLPKLLDYLTETSRLYDFTKLTNRTALEAALREMVDNQPLPEFCNLFEQLTLLCINPNTHLFDTTEFRRLVGVDAQKDFYILPKHLAQFLNAPNPTTGGQLMREIDRMLHLEQSETRAVASLLHKAWRELTVAALSSQKEGALLDWSPYKTKRMRELATIPPDRLLKWGLLWSANEPRVHQQNPLTVVQGIINQMLPSTA